MTLDQVKCWMDEIAPPALAESWDNPGLLVRCSEEVSGVLCTLDITPPVVQEALQNHCNLILAHHPVIFHPLRSIAANDVPALLLQNGISALCAHTNLDAAQGGVNDVLAEMLQLQNTRAFVPCGRVGTLAQGTTMPELLKRVGQLLQTQGTYYNAGGVIKTLAVVSGAGGEFMRDAKEADADCLMTGEVKYHEALEAQELGISYIAAGHFETEFPVTAMLAQKLSAAFPQLRVCVATQNKNPIQFF